MFKFFVAVFITLTVLDAYLTQLVLSSGGLEGNPIVAWLFNYNIVLAYMVKAIGAIGIIFGIWFLNKEFLKVSRVIIIFVTIFFLVTVVHNLIVYLGE